MSDTHPKYGWRDNLLFWLAGLVGVTILRLLFSTIRTRVYGEQNRSDARKLGPGPLAFALWHNRLLGPCWQNRGEGVCVLSSQHRDSEYIVRVVKRLGFYSVRGSATRGGVRGMLAMLRAMQEGHDLALTVDGPKGPVGVVKPGLIYAASRSGCPLLPSAVSYSAFWSLHTWDRLRIPKPFSRMSVVYGEPMLIPDKPDEAEVERLCLTVAARVDECAALADNLVRPVEHAGKSPWLRRTLESFLTRPRDRWYQFPLLLCLVPFEALWLGGWLVREYFYRRGLRAGVHSLVPAVCVGSLSAGGAGKTPAALLIAGLLQKSGYRVALLSRGYKRPDGEKLFLSGPAPREIPPGELAVRAGDEAALAARRLPALILAVSPDRRAAAAAAVEQFGAQVLVMDDGFGHRSFGRSMDLLTLTPRILGLTGHVLPAGYLREPRFAADRARALLFVLDEDESTLEVPVTWRRDKVVMRLVRKTLGLQELAHWPGESYLEPAGRLRGRKVLAICGLAHPESFRDSLALSGAGELEVLAWPDHFAWPEAAQRQAAERARATGAILVTTEKDAVKLDPALVGPDCLVLCQGLEDRSHGALGRILDELLLPADGNWRRSRA